MGLPAATIAKNQLYNYLDYSPLAVAARSGNSVIVKFLLANGAKSDL